MAIKDFFHPIFRRALDVEEEQHGLHDTIVDTLQAPVDQAKKDELNAKIDAYLDTSRGDYLDRFGSWFGLSRKKDWTDDYYRDRMKKHVLHERNTIIGIRMALANFLETEIGNIQIYEPYRDMAIFNKSFYNTRAFYTSPYYRYAVIDIKVDAPIKPGIVDIINLFRPAGVLWVLTNTINGGLDAPIIDLLSPKSVSVLEEDLDYIGFNTRKALEINPGLDSANSPITNPFIYNDSDSLWNEGKVYYDIVHQNQNFTYLGQMYTDYVPGDTDTFADGRAYSEQYPTNSYTSNINGDGQRFNLLPDHNNLLGDNGRNLLLDTEFNDLPQYWISRAGKVTGTFNGNNVIYYDATNLTNEYTNVLQQPIYNPATTNRVLPNQWYTLSFYVKGSGRMTIYVYPSFVDSGAGCYVDGVKSNYAQTDGSQIWDLTDTWVRHVYTFKSKSSFPDGEMQNVLFRAFKGNEVYICMPKLEAGTLATPWTPAPEDNSDIFVQKIKDIVPGNYQVGIRAYANTSKTEAINLTFNDTGGKNVTQTISSSVGTERHYFTRQISIPEGFKSDGTVTFNVGNTTLDFVSIKKATNAPMYYSLKDDEEQSIYGLASAIDIQRYLLNYDNHDLNSDFSKLDDTFSYYDLNLSLSSNVANEATMYVYNFQLGLWVNFGTESIQRGWNYLTTSLGAISSYLNSNGILFYRILFKNQNTVIVNYFGLNLGYTKEQPDPAMVESGKGVKVFTEGYSSRVDPTADGAHLYLDYNTRTIEN